MNRCVVARALAGVGRGVDRSAFEDIIKGWKVSYESRERFGDVFDVQ